MDPDCNSLRKGDPPYMTNASFTGVTTLSDLSIAGSSLYEPSGSYLISGGLVGRFILSNARGAYIGPRECRLEN